MSLHKLYRKSHNFAVMFGDEDAYYTSLHYNIACKCDIDIAIKHNHDGFYFNPVEAVNEVIAKHGFDRTMWVCSATIQLSYTDSRYSVANKIWASHTIPNTRRYNCKDMELSSSPAFINAFVTELRNCYDAKGLIGLESCLLKDYHFLDKRVLVLKPEALDEDMRTPDRQYFYSYGGYGCYSKDKSKSIEGEFLCDGEKATFLKADILGVADESKLPEWLKKKLEPIKYLETIVDTPTGNSLLCIPVQSLSDFIDGAVLKNSMLLPITCDNATLIFDKQNNGNYGYSIIASSIVSTPPLSYDHTIALIRYAEYTLANAQEPKPILEAISEQIYLADKDVYGKILYLTDIDTCEQAIKLKQDYLRKFIPIPVEEALA